MSPRSLRSSRRAVAFAVVVASAAVGCSRTSFVTRDAADAADAASSDASSGSMMPSAGDDGSLVATSADGIEGVACAGKTCKDRGIACGVSDDGCGKTIDCGSCTQGGETCTAGTCSCTPKTCADLPAVECGFVSDGCGGNIACGGCDAGHCTNNICTSSACQLSIVMPGECGDPVNDQVPDGCSSTQDGETCGANQTCGGGGTVNRCGCSKITCEQAGAECGGSVADGCGGQMSCGECSDPPGTCSGNHCQRCIAVPDASLGFEARCGQGSLPHAWACSCANGICDVPDPASDSPPSCALLENTAQHAVYCCTSAGSP